MCTSIICLLVKKKMEKSNSKSRSLPASHKLKGTSILTICLVQNRSLSSRRYVQPPNPHLTHPHLTLPPHTPPPHTPPPHTPHLTHPHLTHSHHHISRTPHLTITSEPSPSTSPLPTSLSLSLLSHSQLFHCSLLSPHNPTPPTPPNLNDRSAASHLRQQVSRPLYP